MLKNIFDSFKNLEKKAKIIMKKGLEFCSVLCIISIIILLTYNLSFTVPIVFIIGFSLFKLSVVFGIEFIICGLVADKVKKELPL